MAETILISSSPPQLALDSVGHRESTKIFHGSSTVHFDIDSFDSPRGLDFSFERPAKRPRGGGSFGPPAPKKHRAPVGLPELNLSSDVEPEHVVDDIEFTSSINEQSEGRPPAVDLDLSSDSLPGDLPLRFPSNGASTTRSNSVTDGFSARTSNLLANLSSATRNGKKPTSNAIHGGINRLGAAPSGDQARDIDTYTRHIIEDIDTSSSQRSQRPPGSRKTHADHGNTGDQLAVKPNSTEARAEKEAQRLRRQEDKEAEKRRRQEEKHQRAKDKKIADDLAAVNRAKTDKKETSKEMIIDVSDTLEDTSIGRQIVEHMNLLAVEVNFVSQHVDLTDEGAEPRDQGNHLRWRRKVTAIRNEESDQWERLERDRVEDEKHALIHLTGQDFALIAAGSERPGHGPRIEEMKANIDAHTSSLRSRFGDCQIIYLIQGLHSWLKTRHNAKNREYIAAVRGHAENDGEAAPQAKRKRKAQQVLKRDLSFVTADVIEELLLHLQIAHQPLKIHHTATADTAASQIVSFTQELSRRPYRLAEMDLNLKSASFCMGSGQVKTGDDAQETFVHMLQALQRVTPSMAYGIGSEYKSVKELVDAFRKHGNLVLENVHKSTNKDGGWSDRRLGPAVSKRLYKVFMGRDPTAMDGMS